jgi:catechol 2,3-dioxygenase-like lactoylglutathione lyase family enzyme
MLGNKDVVATVAVRDLAAARRWYEGTLGLEAESTEGDEVVTYRTGSSRLMVYRSQYAGTNKATGATWVCEGDVDAAVRELRGKGVAFEHYDFPDTKLEGDVHVMGDMRVAWFKDPDGNIFSLVNGKPSAVRG